MVWFFPTLFLDRFTLPQNHILPLATGKLIGQFFRLGVGFSLVVAPVYNAEISPASVRGVLSSLLDVSAATVFERT
jgi:hypothetical protein